MTYAEGERTGVLGRGQALLWGGLVVGTIDILEIIVFTSVRGVPPQRVLQSVASGLLGREAYAGGNATAILGLLLHFVIAFAAVGAYQVASRRFRWLVRSPVLWGLVYGLLVYALMDLVVVPLSAAALGPRTLESVLNGVAVHMLGVGLPAAFFARAAAPRASGRHGLARQKTIPA